MKNLHTIKETNVDKDGNIKVKVTLKRKVDFQEIEEALTTAAEKTVIPTTNQKRKQN